MGLALLSQSRARGVWRYDGAGTFGEPFALLAEDDEVAARLAGSIVEELDDAPGRWKLTLTDLPVPDPVLDALADRLPHAVRQRWKDTPLLRFDGVSPINHYLSRNVRSAVAKARNRIARDGLDLDLRWLSAPERIGAVLAEVVEVRQRRNEHLHRGGSDGAELATFTATITNQAAAGRARLLELRIDSALAAYAVCFVSGRLLWVYSNTVSPDFTRYSAGRIANAEVVRYAHGDPGITVLSWGRGLQRYKVSGPVTLAEVQSLTAWSSPSTRRLLTVGRTLRGLNPIG